MVGSLVLRNCLTRKDVDKVTIITRREIALSHPKLIKVVHDNFLDFSNVDEYLSNQDVCIYCIGVYTGSLPSSEFTKVTVDYTKAFAEALREMNDKVTLCFLSGQGADSTEKSRTLFARDKGRAENILLSLGFDKTFIFRPGYIYPVIPRKEPNLLYVLTRVLYKPILSKLFPNMGLTSEQLATAMIEAGINGASKTILENLDILQLQVNPLDSPKVVS